MSKFKGTVERDQEEKAMRRKLSNLWTFIRNIPSNLKMIAQWIPVLWNNWDWDHMFLMEVLKYKLLRMQKYMKKHAYVAAADQLAAQMKACTDIIDRLEKNRYTEKEIADHDEKYGPLSMEPDENGVILWRPKARELGLEEEEAERRFEIYLLGEKRREKDLEILFRIMQKRMEYWWD